MIKNLHFVVELGREIKKAPAWRVDGPRSSYDSVPLHESGLKPLLEEAGA
jgi:hypothetical protein